jgi:hypothetical protein
LIGTRWTPCVCNETTAQTFLLRGFGNRMRARISVAQPLSF